MARNWTGSRGVGRSAAIAAALLLGLPAVALARTETLHWTHRDDPPVTGFKVHWGTASGAYTEVVDVGRPTQDAEDRFSYDLQVADTLTIYVAVTAYDDQGNESAYSNQKVRTGEEAPPPPPPPPSEPPPDAAWDHDFEGSPTGTYVQGWVDTGPWGSLVEQDDLFRVIDLSGNRALTTDSTATDIHSHLISTESAGWTSYEVRARVRVSSNDARIGVTAVSQFLDAAVLYRLSSAWVSGELELHGAPWDGATKSCVSKGTGVVPQPDVWYDVRLQVIPKGDHNLLRAKAWPSGGSEPAGWQAECADYASDRPEAGTVGAWSGRSGAKYWDDFVVLQLDADGNVVAGDGTGGTGGTGGSDGGTGDGGGSGSGDGSTDEPLGAPGQPFLLNP